MRYFFHVKNGKSFKDEVGRRFSNGDNALAHAKVIASELAIEAGSYQGYTVCVMDVNGNEVARVPIEKGYG